MNLKIKSPAKINLTLEVINKFSSGFHELRTVMLKLENLKDDLEIKIKKGPRKIIIHCDNPEIPLNNKNTCYKAGEAFLDKIKKEVQIEITLKKKIPIGAGLGGGSSNEGMLLKNLNKYFNNYFVEKDLIEIAASVGKDIPFFLTEKRVALIGGAGEKILKNIDFKNKGCFLIVNPNINVATPEAYSKLSEDVWYMKNKNRENISSKIIEALISRDDFSAYFFNDFEYSIEKEHPIIKEIKQTMKAFGAQGVLMSGSGSTVFGWFADKQKSYLAQKNLQKKYKKFLVEIG